MPRAATFSPPLHTFKTMATFLLFLFWLNILPKEVSSAPSQFANPLLCSFSDNAAGFYASWHSNCSGLVNFIVNVRNFPRPDLPTFGFFRDSLFGHFWTGIGFKLISTQMALIENLSGAFVSVTPARLDHGLPPIREIGAGILINPRGSFVGSTLEATFAIDESLFGTGCREFMFFTALTPIGAPYGAVPFSKTICDVARTCSRYKCDDFGVFPSGIYQQMPMALNDAMMPSMGMPGMGGMPPMDYFDADSLAQMPLTARQSLLATASALTNGQYPNYYGTGMGLRGGGGRPSDGIWPPPQSIYYNYQQQQQQMDPYANYYGQMGGQQYGQQYGGTVGQFNNLCPPVGILAGGQYPFCPTTPNYAQSSPMQYYQQQYQYSSPSITSPYSSSQLISNPYSAWNPLISPLEKDKAKRATNGHREEEKKKEEEVVGDGEED